MDSHRGNLALAAALGLTLAAAGCGKARTPTASEGGGRGLQLAIEQATVTADRRVEVTYRLTNANNQARGAAGVENRWTLAQLATDPQGVPAYSSLVLTGPETTVDGVPLRQPGFETNGTVADLGDGRFRYTYATQLPEGYDTTASYRVGVFSRLDLTPADTTDALFDADAPNVVFDFVPAGGAAQKREVVADAGCSACHVQIRAHGEFRRGVAICTTCHTWQLYDPDTKDPARPDQPNPLDLGRMVHRIHRGNDLPTVAKAVGAAQAASGDARNAILADPQATYSVIGFRGTEFVFGGVPRPGSADHPQVLVENGISRIAVAGVNYPQDIRNCAACHRPDAEDAAEVLNEPSKRTCQGCHADVVFDSATLPTAPSGTAYYRPHPAVPGFPFVGNTPSATCAVCHGANGIVTGATVAAAHVEPHRSPDYNPLTFTIVDVTNVAPGQNPTVTFEVADRAGPVTDLKVLDAMNATLSGSTHEYAYTRNFLSRPILVNAGGTKTVNATPVEGTPGRYQIAFANRPDGDAAIRGDATGTWAFSLEGRRVNAAITASERAKGNIGSTANFYDKPNNPVKYVAVTGGEVEPRRTVVSTQRCNACHDQLSFHGGQRNETQYCVFCHAHDATDWGTPALTGVTAGRPKIDVGGVPTVNLAATPDNLEERSIHLKNMIHRIHTGESLEVTRPYSIYGFRTSLFYFDEIRVPLAARARCTSCHEGETWTLEAMPQDAAPTIANETPNLKHTGTSAHAGDEPVMPPVYSACISCHDTPRARQHADAFVTPGTVTTGGTDRCRDCHSEGRIAAVKTVHPNAGQ